MYVALILSVLVILIITAGKDLADKNGFIVLRGIAAVIAAFIIVMLRGNLVA